MHLKDGLPPLRNQRTLRVLLPTIRAAKNRFGVRICHWSILSNHLHLLVDSNSEQCLAKAMQGFKIRVAKALNRLWKRKGTVFTGRYFARLLRKPMEVRRALVYVIQNARRHGILPPKGLPDPFSSGMWFTGWRGRKKPFLEDADPPMGKPVWWETISWRNIGLLDLDEVPACAPSGAGTYNSYW